MMTSCVRKITSYHFITLLPWENTFWSLGLECKIFRNIGSVVGGLLAKGHQLTWGDQVMLLPEKKEIPSVLRLIVCLEQSSLLFLSVTLSQLLDWCDLVTCFHRMHLYFKTDQAKKILHCTDPPLSCLSSLTHQRLGHLLVCWAPDTCIWKWHIFFVPPFSAPVAP